MRSKICIVTAEYYSKISERLYNAAASTLEKNNIKKYKSIFVPGSFEIPVIISKNMNRYDGFIALGCIIKGKTPHFNYISNAITNSIMHLSILNKKPIGNGIITCLNKKQALERSSLNIKEKNKGVEATEALLSVLRIIKDEFK